MTERLPALRPHVWGYLALASGALALGVAMLHIFGGPFAPTPSAAQTVGEIAGEIRASALRALRGEAAPPAAPRGWDVDRVLLVAAPMLGVVALVAAAISALVKDPWRLALSGAALGATAIVFQFVWWIAMLVLGVCLLIVILQNIGSILGG